MLSPRIRQARRGESSGGHGSHRETSPGGRGEGAAAAEAPGSEGWEGGGWPRRGLRCRGGELKRWIPSWDSEESLHPCGGC